MRRALGGWVAAWLLIGVVDLALGLVNGAPGDILALAALTVIGFMVVGGFVIVFVYGNARAIERVPERTLAIAAVVTVLLVGAGIILLPGLTFLASMALGLFAAGFGAIRLTMIAMSGRRRGERPDDEAARRNARRDAVFASAASHTGEPATGASDGERPV